MKCGKDQFLLQVPAPPLASCPQLSYLWERMMRKGAEELRLIWTSEVPVLAFSCDTFLVLVVVHHRRETSHQELYNTLMISGSLLIYLISKLHS